MPKKLPVSELLRIACAYAQRDQESFIDAYGGNMDEPAVRDAADFVKQIREYRLKRWGASAAELLFESALEVPVEKIAGRKNRSFLAKLD